MNKRRPYNFVHDITLRYSRFATLNWFYPATGYSEAFQKKCYKFDGQIFYKEKAE